MWKIWCCLFLINAFSATVTPSRVDRVRLVDVDSYATSIMQKTIHRVEKRRWCNLKIDDMRHQLSETVLSKEISAEIDLKNGFVVSIQKIGVVPNSIKQAWLPRTGNMTMVEVQSILRMTDVAIGFDVITKVDGKASFSTGLIVYNETQFQFAITKHLFTDEITVNIVGAPLSTNNRMQFIPENDVTKIFTVRFGWNSIAPSVARWATEIFEPIALELATKEMEFPRICYNCNT